MLAPDITEAVLEKLGFSERPAVDRAGLDAIYAAWCERVPFDNLVKRVHLASGSAAPLPNGTPEGFFASWLADGAGGTCWPSAAGLHGLLVSLGFGARRGSGAMLDDLSGPVHNHGTTIVRLDGADLFVDSSMLTRRVFELRPGAETHLDDPVNRVRVEPVEHRWRVWWTHNFVDQMLRFLLLADDVSGEHYLARYEVSREESPFNTAVYATRTVADARITLAFGRRHERRADGITSAPLGDDRDRVLIEEFGYSEAIVARLPADDPPPPRK